MPVNFLQLLQQIKEAGSLAQQRSELHEQLCALAKELLLKYAAEIQSLQQRVEEAANTLPALRCAVPVQEPLNDHRPAPQQPASPCILAADGSQINPDHHRRLEFGMINIGVFKMQTGANQVPQEKTFTKLLMEEDLRSSGGSAEDVIALMRDAQERVTLAELAAAEVPPVVALTDGPLELFRQPRQERLYRAQFEKFLRALEDLSRLSAAVAGFEDKPRADLIVRLLELAYAHEKGSQPESRPLEGVRDFELYSEILKPGERSAVFALQSLSSKDYKDRLKLYFFYLNVGTEQRPWLARVEIPQWVAASAPLLDLLHRTLVDQCQALATRPYPYALHRAHEVALISREEAQQIEDMLVREMRQQGVEVGEQSNKQTAKDISGQKTRYKP